MKKIIKYYNQNPPLFWISMLRIIIGLMFLSTWLPNMLDGLYTPDGLLRFFTFEFPQSQNPITFYGNFIENVILPIRNVFAPFQLVTELLLGVALLIGIFSPLASLAGIFFLLNTMLATLGHDWIWSYILPISILVVVFFSRAGRMVGLDALLHKRYSTRLGILW